MVHGRSVKLTLFWLIFTLLGGSAAVFAGVAESPDSKGQEFPAFTLRQCVQIALESSVSLAVAKEQRHLADQDVKAAVGAFFPDLTLSHVNVKDSRTDFDVSQFDVRGAVVDARMADTGVDTTLIFGLQVPADRVADQTIETSYRDFQASSNLNVFAGFSKFSGLRSARNNLKAAQANEAYYRDLVVQNVASAYYNLLRYERLLEVALESRDLAARELEKSETYFRLGSAAKSDVLQARVRLEQTKLEVVRSQNAVAQAFADLAYAMNQPLAERFEVDRSPLQTDFELELLEDLYAEALRSRPDLISHEYTVEAANQDVTTAGSNLWPSLNLFAQYQRYNNESPFRFGSQESDLLRYGYQVRWNVFDRMTTLTGRSKAKANARIAQYNLEQAKLDAQLEIRQIFNLLVEARERASHSRETIIQAQEELRLAQERFRVGAGTTLERITAQVNLAQARAEEVQAICDFLINLITLDRAVGRPSALLGPHS
jgi:outer membrane protein TolC